MNTKLTRRLALALPFAIPAIGTIDTLAETPAELPATVAENTEPEIIPGLNQIKTLHLFAIVKTPDGRNGVVQLTCTGDEDGVEVQHIGDSASGDFSAHVPTDPYATLPTWLLRECGLAALSATPHTRGGVK